MREVFWGDRQSQGTWESPLSDIALWVQLLQETIQDKGESKWSCDEARGGKVSKCWIDRMEGDKWLLRISPIYVLKYT